MRFLEGIDIEKRAYSIYNICRELDRGHIGYDRDGMEILLNDVVLSKIIESIFIGIPLPSAYINTMSEEHSWEAITGHTVLEALNRFVNKNELRLTGLEIFPQLNDSYFSDLPDYWKDGLFAGCWDLIFIRDRGDIGISKGSRKKNNLQARENIYAIIKEFNG